MFRLDAEKSVSFCDGIRRRDFLHAGALGLAGLTLPDLFSLQAQGAANSANDMNCIFLMLLGGPSQLDTFDMKPNAPAEIRGPFKPIKTNVSGIEISEIFPLTARQADKFAIVRSLHHEAAAVHDTGHQLMQTGRLFEAEYEHPNIGSVLAKLRGSRGEAPPHVLLPHPIGKTGGNLPHGQTAGFLGQELDPFVPPTKRSLMSSASMREAFDLTKEPEAVKDRYGRNKFGMNCLLARRMIERGVRFVTVNQFETVFNEVTWDCHGSAPFSSIDSYRNEVGPMFDHAYSALLEDLHQRGLLKNTLVVATGEFGRTPHLNPMGGRDHWTNCWSMLFAGGGVKGGQVIGSSDEIGAYPKDRPVTPAEVAATMLHSLKIDLETELPGPEGCPVRIVDHCVSPISELF